MTPDRDIDSLTYAMPGEDKAEFFDLQVGGGAVDPERHARSRPSEDPLRRPFGELDEF